MSRSGVRAIVARLPTGPGVYRFADERGRTLYVGRAVDLRRRVGSYWGDLGDRWHLRRMVARIARVDALACDSGHEAAWLERNVLERSLPPWNRTAGGQEVPLSIVVDRDPPGLRTVHDAAASPLTFGPYLGGTQARLAVSGLLRAFPLRYAVSGLRRRPPAPAGVHRRPARRVARTLGDIEDRRAAGDADAAAVEGVRPAECRAGRVATRMRTT